MLAMNSCEKENEMNTGEQKGTPVEFEMGINSITRTTTADDSYETAFAEGDSVGIFVYNGTELVKANAHYKLNADQKWVAQGNDAIYAETGKTYSYYAYYPYNANPGNYDAISLAAQLDQKTNGYTSSDALMAKAEVETVGENTTVQLQYKHAYALVQVKLSGNDVVEGAAVTLENVFSVATINLKDQQQNAASDVAGSITMKPCDATAANGAYYYRAIVPAQTIEAGKALVKVYSSEKTYQFTYNQAVEYESGKLRQINITLGEAPKQSTITITGADKEIADWGNSEDLKGEGNTTETSRFQIPTGTGNDTIVMAYNYDPSTITNQTGDFWFYRTNKKTITEANEQGTVSIVDETINETQAKAININCINVPDNKNSYYIVSLGYYMKNSGCAPNKKYKLSFKVKGTNGTKLLSTIRVAGSKASVAVYNNDATPTTTTKTFTLGTDDWETATGVFDFSQKAEKVSSISTDNPLSATVAEDLTNIDIRLYPQTGGLNFTIADVTLEEYTK